MADFIITSLQSWDIEIGSTIKNTAFEISKQHRVLYVNPPMDIATRVRIATGKGPLTTISRRQIEVIQGKSPIRYIKENLWVLDSPFTIHSVGQLPTWLFNSLNRKNGKKIGNWIMLQAENLGFKDYVHLIDTDLFRSLHLKEYIHPKISIYYRRDYIIGVDYWRKYGPACEQALVRQADIVMTNSSYFTEELKPLNPNIYTTNTGVNLSLYDGNILHDIPADLKDIPSPRIGYTGAIIERRLDADLLYAVAQQLPQYNFVFVGPEDDFFAQHPLHTLKNTYFTGHREVAELPAYIQHFDVCLNPQKVNPITEGNYPLKIDEYLAIGKPVVATSTHTMREVFAEYTHLATDVDSYLYAIQKALGETEDAELKNARIAFAQTHSWAHSVEKIYKAIDIYKTTSKK